MARRIVSFLVVLACVLLLDPSGAPAQDPASSTVVRDRVTTSGTGLSPAAQSAVRRIYLVHRGLNAATATPERMALIEEIRRAKSLLPVTLGTRSAAAGLPQDLTEQRDKIQERIDALESDPSGSGLDPGELTRFQDALDAWVVEVQAIRAQPRSSARSARAGRLLREERGRNSVREDPARDQMSATLWKRWTSGKTDPGGPKAVLFDKTTGQVRLR